MTTSLSRTQAIAVVLVLAALIGGWLLWRHHQQEAKDKACADMFGYSMYADSQGYSGELRDPKFLTDKQRCFG